MPIPSYHYANIVQTVKLNKELNAKAQAAVDAAEPKRSIWEATSTVNGKASSEKALASTPSPAKLEKRQSFLARMVSSSSTKEAHASLKADQRSTELASLILQEEAGRWPDAQWRQIVRDYQIKTGMLQRIAHLREVAPIQYLHLLRAGYFEPIPRSWADQVSNPLKFSIEASEGWRGITPSWRGYEDTAEERLYWVLNHREGATGTRMKPDMISELTMARERMAKAVEPPPVYYSASDTCHVQHTDANGYSKQVMPQAFHAYDRPEMPTDDTMILLDVSGSMDFEPMRPVYEQYLITSQVRSNQPKNKGERQLQRSILIAYSL